MFLINKQQEEIASGKQKVGENRSKYEPERKHKIGIIKPKSLTKLKQALEKKIWRFYTWKPPTPLPNQKSKP